MTYSGNETSTEGGRPVEIYVFTTGGTIQRYTSAEDEVTVGVNTYEPVAIRRSDTADGPEEREHDFTFELPSSDEVAQLFAGVLTGDRTRVTVSRYHRGDTPTPEVVVIFDGYVQSARFTDDLAVCRITARSVISSLGRQAPARTFQAMCNHVLYTCRVDDTDSSFRASAVSATSQVGSLLTVSGLGAFAAGWFTGGYVEEIGTGIRRLILNDDGAGGLTLLVPFAVAPTTVNVFAGCDHTGATCQSKFDNLINFGGFPFVPTKNPFSTGL
jgi:uncharacterized phage protein (TIGR02218 family)